MLGYKQILPINVFIVFCVVMFAWFVTPWWAQLTADSYPGHAETAFFFYMLATILVYWNVGRLAQALFNYNRRRYHEQYELEVNNFFFQFAPLMAEKLERYNKHQELNQLLKLAIAQLNQSLEAASKEHRHAVR